MFFSGKIIKKGEKSFYDVLFIFFFLSKKWFKIRNPGPWSWRCIAKQFCISCTVKSKETFAVVKFKPHGNSIRRNCDLKQRNRKSPEDTPIERVSYVTEICRIGEGKRVHQVEYLQDEQLIIALTGRQRQMRLIPIREAIHRIYLFKNALSISDTIFCSTIGGILPSSRQK